MSLAEAARLALILRADPSSALTASMEGWAYPISREAIVLADLFDLTAHAAGVKHPKPHSVRPYDVSRSSDEVTRRGAAPGRTRDEIVAILNDYREGRGRPHTTGGEPLE